MGVNIPYTFSPQRRAFDQQCNASMPLNRELRKGREIGDDAFALCKASQRHFASDERMTNNLSILQ